jgi:6,7-dimethyl-8-ribityllumazine synthase
VKPASSSELPRAENQRVAIVTAEFYPALADWLEDGARRALDACGVPTDARRWARVPGCYELPLAARKLIDAELPDAVIALGVVIRGETAHFDFVAGACANGIMTVQLETGVPIAFGVLTTDSLAQAEERADPQRGDKGFSATVAALRAASVG